MIKDWLKKQTYLDIDGKVSHNELKDIVALLLIAGVIIGSLFFAVSAFGLELTYLSSGQTLYVDKNVSF